MNDVGLVGLRFPVTVKRLRTAVYSTACGGYENTGIQEIYSTTIHKL
jgi:hypothetical protein